MLNLFSSSFLFLICLATQHLNAQNSSTGSGHSKTDSLLTLLKTDKEDTNKFRNLDELCWENILAGEYDKGLVYGKQALMLSQVAYKEL
jgi:hypothetical protein